VTKDPRATADDATDDLGKVDDPTGVLRGLFAHSPVPFIIFADDGHSLASNRAYREMFGALSPEYNVLRDEVAERIGLAEAVQRAFQGEALQTPVFWYDPQEVGHPRALDAKRVAISCSFIPLDGTKGKPPKQVAIAFKDVTAEYQAREHAEAERDLLRVAVEEKERLAKALQLSEERLRHTLEAAEVGTWEWDIQANHVSWSPNIESIHGLPPGGFSGTYEAWLALVHPADRTAMKQRVSAAIEQGAAYETEFRSVRPDGSTRWHHTRGYIIKDEQGRPKLFRGIVFEVTEELEARRQAETLAGALRESEARYRAFVGQSSEGIWRIETGRPIPISASVEEQIDAFYEVGCLAECNDAMARMYGYERASELTGKRLGEFLVREDPRNHEYLAAFIQSGYRLEGVESRERDRFGNARVFQNGLVGIIEDGCLRRAWGTQRDITSEVTIREESEAASRSKDEFLAMLGHELRNPLSPILTALELMKLRDGAAFAKERSIIERQVRHVVRLVDDLLDVSRMTQGKISIDRRPVDLADAVALGIELASPLLEQRAHRLSVNIPRGLVVSGDPTRLGQVVANLLTNAAKYTPSGGNVVITGDRSETGARVSVSDTGIGIRPELLAGIFEMFVQGRQAMDRAEGGLGLGLAIVRSLITLHGGTVEARSAGPGLGSEFIVQLPLQLPVRADGLAPPLGRALQESATPAGWRVLIVDDNQDAAELLAEALSESGYVVRVALDGAAALRALQEERPDVALLDIGLPVMDGYELARRVRSDPALRSLRMLAVTGYGQAKDRAKAEAAGFDAHLVKPVDLQTLEAELARVMAQPARD
jgi:PAS domain S-box-containing protein